MVVKNVEKAEAGKVKITVELSGDEFEAAVNKAFIKRKNSISIPGFRRGKAPRAIVEGMYGKDFFYEDAVNEAAPDAFAEAVADGEIKTVGRPGLIDVDIAEDKTVSLFFETAVYPEVKPGLYKGLEAEKEPVDVTDKDIEAEVERVRLRNARLENVSRPAQTDDEVTIDFVGTVDGVPFDGGEGKNHKLVLGSGQFVPGFEDGIIGMEPGGEKDIEIVFPENYHKELAGKAAVFHVAVRDIKENRFDDIDDEFAKDVSEFETLEEYKADIRENLLKIRQRDSDQRFREDLLDIATENMTVDVPEAMIDEKVGQMAEELAGNLQAQGLTIEKYLEFAGMSEADFFASARPTALKNVKRELLLSQIAKEEGIEATDAEIDDECQNIAERYGIEPEKAKEGVNREFIEAELKMKKAADLIFESGTVKAHAAKPKKSERKKEKKDEPGAEADGQKPEAEATEKTVKRKRAAVAADDKKPAAKKSVKKPEQKEEAQ